MTQNFKSFYLQDDRISGGKGRPITIAFGEDEKDLFGKIKPMSSENFRKIIGITKMAILEKKAEKQGLPISTFCLSLIRKKINELNNKTDGFIDPMQVTFRGGIEEPFQAWYPYLEGYSPDFVRSIISKYMPNVNKILDPFAGSGTTPVTVIRENKSSYFCEINPAMQFLINAKILALKLNRNERLQIVQKLRNSSETIITRIKNANPDLMLLDTYKKTFGESGYFPLKEFDLLLQTRTYIDNIACNEPILAKYLSVCILSILIPISNMVRRGDLRFMTENEKKSKKTSFSIELQQRIQMIANDIENTEEAKMNAYLICENACNLANIPTLNIDSIITSPPYLNGTNYFRNTKMELWFLRCLRNTADLSSFRYKAITAGINDVTKQKDDTPALPEIKTVYNELKTKAYDARIPAMVSAYFNDMNRTFDGVTKHIMDFGKIAIDIGDSIYADIHVPTDNILTKLLERKGCHLIDKAILRERVSRGGAKLHQVLLIYEYRAKMRVMINGFELSRRWEKPWVNFKQNLPHQAGEYAKRNWGHPLHSLCSYQGKMKPSLASYLVRTFVAEGDKILDPFSGVGTIPFEAALNGIKSYAFDISPTAYFISMAKIGVPSKQICEKIIDKLDNFIEQAETVQIKNTNIDTLNFNGKITEYFHIDTLQEIIKARKYFLLNKPANASEALVMSCLLHILHGNRPYALSRRSHPITPFAPSGEFEYRGLILRLSDKVNRSFECGLPTNFVEGTIYNQDATSWWPQDVEGLDAIITSPPFFDSTRFYLANWMRLWFCGWEKEDFKVKPLSFVDERQKTSMLIYEPILQQARERLKSNGIFVFHLGKSLKCNMGDELKRISKKWFKNADLFTESVKHCESHGIRDKGTVTDHQYLVLS